MTARPPTSPSRRVALQTLAGLGLAAAAGVSVHAQGSADTAAADWPLATPEAQGLDVAAVAATLRAGEDLPFLRALLAARDGRLVAERYYGGAGAQSLLAVNSCTKSVVSMLVGLALRDGRLKSLEQTVAELLPEAAKAVPDSPAAAVTLRQILLGRTGLAHDPMAWRELLAAPDLVRYALTRPPLPAPADGWTYNDAMVSLLAPILARAQGAELATVAARQLFDPLGIERFQWQRDRQGQALAGGGLALRPRDLLKLAQLMLDQGRWRDTAVLPPDWVADSLAPQGPASWRAGAVGDTGYGRLWFTGRLHGRRVAWAWGYGGQFALLAPESRMVVASAATSPAPQALRAQTDAVMALVGRLVQSAA